MTATERVREALWGDSVRRTATVVALAFVIAAIVYLVVVHALDIETEVIRDRYWKNVVPLFDGEIPVLEYPPLVIVFIAIPRLFASSPWGYEVAYTAMMVVFTVIGMLLMSRLAGDLGHDRRKAMVIYGILSMVMIEFVLDRFDMIAMVFTLAAVVMIVERRNCWAFFFLAVATLVKVYPGVLFPALFLYLLMGRDYGGAAKGFAVYAGTGLAVVAVCWLIDPDMITNFINYNSGRPLQVESLPASLVYLLSMFGLTDVWIQGSSAESFWSDNLRGPLADSVADTGLVIVGILLIACWALYVYLATKRGEGDGMRLLALAMLASLLVFIGLNKVFSSQYLIWIIAPVVMAVMFMPVRRARRLFLITFVAMFLVQLNFAYNVGYLGGGANIDDLGMMIILAKNLAIIAALAFVLREMTLPAPEEGASWGAIPLAETHSEPTKG
ncbi:MAG: glycosyltransferase 87 family protein [Thermoplasmata archaeon]|nr:glycosyltransferase 87 family protein [Thermoplasmata archaeon]